MVRTAEPTIDWMRIDSEVSINSLAEAGRSGCLGSLQTVSFFSEGHFLNTRDTCRTCETLKLERDRSSREYTSQRQYLQPINTALEKGLFSSLSSVYLNTFRSLNFDAAEEKLNLRKRNVSVFFLLFSDDYNAYY